MRGGRTNKVLGFMLGKVNNSRITPPASMAMSSVMTELEIENTIDLLSNGRSASKNRLAPPQKTSASTAR